jgi:NNP family nitrate/nitrite transporter-like MFS transporter
MMVGLMFLFGLFVAMIPSVAQKTLAVWFPGRQYALAASILNIGWTIGAMIGTMASATVFSPALGGWRNVLLVYGIPPILLSILWQFTIKEPKKTEISVTKEGMGFRQLLSHVIRVKEIWIIGIIALGLLGTGLGIIGYLPAYLRGLGWSNTASAGAITVFSAAGGLGGLPLVILSNRIGSRTKVLIPAGIIFIVTLAFIPFTSGTMTWVMIITGGIVRGCLSPLLSAMAVEREVIGARYAGTALGLIMTLNMLGGAISPPLGNSLAGINAGFPFLLWAAISVMGLIGFFFIKEKRLGITSVS